jgi:NADH-quinone oxidoreductase subunit N
MAYTSINQMGFLLLGAACNSKEGYSASILYLFIYAVMGICFLMIFIHTRREDHQSLLYLTDFRGLGQTD